MEEVNQNNANLETRIGVLHERVLDRHLEVEFSATTVILDVHTGRERMVCRVTRLWGV